MMSLLSNKMLDPVFLMDFLQEDQRVAMSPLLPSCGDGTELRKAARSSTDGSLSPFLAVTVSSN